MSDGTNYKADAMSAPSRYGFDGTDAGVGAATKADIATSSANISLDSKWLGKWITLCPNGATIYLRSGKTADTITAVTTDLKIADGEKFHFIVTKYTQKLGFIGSAAVTNGLLYWGSETFSPYQP